MCARKYIKTLMSIQHLDDIPSTEFVKVVANLKNFTGSIKQDGANLWFGLDGEQLFVSREGKSKNAKPMYTPGDFEDISANDQFKAALIALQTVKTKISNTISPDEVIEIEVIFGAQPNVVKYHDNDNTGSIIFLRSVGSTNHNSIRSLANALVGHSVDVEMPVKTTIDGISVTDETKTISFKFEGIKQIDLSAVASNTNVLQSLGKLQELMAAPSSIDGKSNAELEVFKTSDENKRAKIDTILKLNEAKAEVKQAMMQALSDDGSLNKEGFVLSSKTDDQIYKIVDKHHFTKINDFYQRGRKTAIGVVMTTDPNADLLKRGGIAGNTKIKISTLLGKPDFARAQTVKKSLAELGKDDFLKQFNITDLESHKIKINRVIDDGLKLLNVELIRFKNSKGGKIVVGREELGYTESVISRTKLAFAEAFADLKNLKQMVINSNSVEDLISAVYGRFIDLNTGIVEGQLKMISYTLLEDEAPSTPPASEPSQDKTAAGDIASNAQPVGGKYKFVMRARNDAVLTAMKSKKLKIGGAK